MIWENLGRDLDNVAVSLILQRKNLKISRRNVDIESIATGKFVVLFVVLVHSYIERSPIFFVFIYILKKFSNKLLNISYIRNTHNSLNLSYKFKIKLY